MALQEEELEQVATHVKAHLGEWGAEYGWGKPAGGYELELSERMVRVEEEFKHQRELMLQGFERMDKRFEQVDKRFEQVDKHFAEQREDMKKRFEQVDKRFEEGTRRLDRFMFWSFGLTIAAAGTVITVLKF